MMIGTCYSRRKTDNQLKNKESEDEYTKQKQYLQNMIKRQYEEYLKRKQAEENFERQQYEEYLKRKQYQENLKKRQYEEYLKRRQTEEELQQQQHEEALKRKHYEEALKRKQYEDYLKKRQTIEDFKRQQHEEALKRRQYEETLKRKQYEEHLKKRQTEEDFKKQQYEEALKRKQYEEHLKKRQAEEDLKKQQHEEALKRTQYEETAKRKNVIDLMKSKVDEVNMKQKNPPVHWQIEDTNTSNLESGLFNLIKVYIEKNDSTEDSNINTDESSEHSFQESFGDICPEYNETPLPDNNLEDKKYYLDIDETLFKEDFNTTNDEPNENSFQESFGDICPECNETPLSENNLEDKKVNTQLYKENRDMSQIKNNSKKSLNKPIVNDTKDQEIKDEIQVCEVTVSSETLPLQENFPHSTDVTAGPVIVKLPVVLTECTITIPIESSIKLKDSVTEIKRIRKNVYLKQCKLLPNSENDKLNTGILFLTGFIRKNIEYSTKEVNKRGVLCGKIKHATVNIPFQCTTRVTLNTQPKFKNNMLETEVEFLENIFDPSSCDDEITGGNLREKYLKLIEFFNEKVFCELVSAEFDECDILENLADKECKSPFDPAFHDIKEKVVLFLTLKLLQNQNVKIS